MTAQEFVRYMPANALAQTIVHIVETNEPGGPAEDAVALCWAQLVAIVGEQEASEMVGFLDLSEVQP